MFYNTSRTHTVLRWAKKDVAALHLVGRRCKSVYKLGFRARLSCGDAVRVSVHETITIRNVSCIQFSEIMAAQVHGLTVRKDIKNTGALFRAQSYH